MSEKNENVEPLLLNSLTFPRNIGTHLDTGIQSVNPISPAVLSANLIANVLDHGEMVSMGLKLHYMCIHVYVCMHPHIHTDDS